MPSCTFFHMQPKYQNGAIFQGAFKKTRRRPLQVGRWITGKPTAKKKRGSHYVARPKWAAFHRATARAPRARRARAARHHHQHRHRASSTRHRATTDLAATARRSVLQDLRPELRQPTLLLVSNFAKPSGHLEARVLSSNSSKSKFRPHSIPRPIPKKPSRRSSDTKNRKHSVRPSALAYATAWNIERIISCWLGFFFLEAGRKLSRAGDSAGAARVGGRSSSLPTPSSSIVS